QVGFTLTLRGSKQTAFIFMGDRWSTRNFGKTRLVLLPIVTNGTSLSVPWYDEWNLDAKTGEWSPCAKKFINNNYTITAKHSGLVLGIKSGSNDVVQQIPDGSENQIWNIENRGASHFKITNIASGKSFDVSDESREPGAKLLQWDWKDSYNQKWHIIDCGEGYHRFVSVNTLGKTIEIENSSKYEEANVVLGNFDYKDNQLWRLTAVNPDIVSGSTYMIENRESGKVIDAGSVTGSSDPVIQSTPLEKAGQVWELNDLYNGYYTLTLPNRSQTLDNSYKIEEGAYVTTADSDEKKYAQQWQIVKVTDNYYKIINRFSGKVLDNRNGSSSEGNPVIQYSDNASESSNQQWKFIPADPVNVIPSVNINRNRNTVIYSTIYDLNGKVLKQKYMNSSKMLAKSGLPGGVYLVKASQNGKVIFHRILHTD
ncbi:MAG: T9SS type A sorting domain-containing protein, partial [Fibrobacter sp.]|nr:T9SS type A sorting domain-containing protein [Fibrobacter sp.]